MRAMPRGDSRLRRGLALLAAAVLAWPAAACADDTAPAGADQLARIRRLAKQGNSEAAAEAMRSLYPGGAPADGAAALDYYDVIGNTGRGWKDARAGLEKLVSAEPGNARYRLALARHLTRRAITRAQGMHLFAALAREGLDRQRVLGEWRRALRGLDDSAASIALYQEYLASDPDNASVRRALAAAERAEAKRTPWVLRDQAEQRVAAGHPEQAIEMLERALKLDPKNPWVRFDLSRLYHKQGDKQRGRSLMDAGLTLAPADAEMLYANALYDSLLGEAHAALHLLEKIPEARRTPAMRELQRKMMQEAHGHDVFASATGPR
jgi:predicted Zn-dependent protease